MKTIEEVIDYFSEVANAYSEMACEASLQQDYDRMVAFKRKADDERQLAEWLKELKESRIVLDILGQFLTDSGIDVCCEDLPMIDDYCEKYCDNQKTLCWYRWAKMKAREVNADEEKNSN